jgi:hypothetical protein
MPSSLLKIQFSFAADSAFHVYTLSSEVIWIACDSIHWPVSRPLVMLGCAYSPLWLCPHCGGPMMVIERLTPAQIQLRSPPVLIAA